MDSLDYWKECISLAADECGAVLTNEQISAIAESVQGGHECYGMAFYTPPASDRYSQIEREWKAKLDAKQAELDEYRSNAETAIKQREQDAKDAARYRWLRDFADSYTWDYLGGIGADRVEAAIDAAMAKESGNG